MAGVVQLAESRLPGSDGAYTDQKVIEVEANTALGWFSVLHDLGRIPDWVRITKLTYGVGGKSPSETPGAFLAPAILLAECISTGRLVWDPGEVGNVEGRPLSIAELDKELWFGACGDRAPSKYLVEFGITHSVPK